MSVTFKLEEFSNHNSHNHMRMKFAHFFILIALVLGAMSIQAQTTTLNTIPEGVITLNLAATGSGQNLTSYFSLPLTADPVYTGVVSAISASTTNDDTISVADSPAPWTSGALATAAAPYFVKFLSGNETGRVILVTANTTNSVTLDITDHSSQTTPLNATNFNVQVGDAFEISPADTLGSVFGNNTTQNPLLLNGSSSLFTADTVSLYNPALFRWQAYYFNTTAGYWELSGTTTNANNTILYPYGALTITRRPNEAATAIAVTGRVAEVPIITKTTGSNAIVYGSTDYPADLTLSQLQLGPNWSKSSSVFTADTISIWDAALFRFDTYYQLSTDSTWRKSGNSSTDQSSFVIPTGSAIGILKRGTVSGQASFVPTVSTLPYSLN